MSRPQSEADYLARLVPLSAAATPLGRRTLFKGALGAGAALGLPALLAACGGSSSGGAGTAVGNITFGSNGSDPVPKKAYAAVMAAFQKATGGVVKTNTVDHNTFQENINNYLQGQPDDVFTWFSGYRTRFFAGKGLVGDVSDVWANLQGYKDSYKTASTGDDGKQYFVPFTYYPWAVFYRKSVWAQHGYTVPTTFDEFKTLAAKMKADGLIPLAFADKDGWPAMGTFDILNLRINGYQFHVDLMAHKESWTNPKVKTVFDQWTGLLPFHQEGALGRTWQEGAVTLLNKKAGMMMFGLFISEQFTKKEDLDDLDFFNFPVIDPTIGGDALDAPIDGFLKAPKPKNPTGATKLLTYLGSKEAATIEVQNYPGALVANSGADTTTYSPLQKKAAEIVGGAKNISQFLDRDTRPDFASTVVLTSLQSYLKDPTTVDALLKSMESQAKTIFTA